MTTRSLGGTLDSLNEAWFFNRPLPRAQGVAAARRISDRQGLDGSYAGTFAPLSADFLDGIRVFTGERVRSRAAVAHILGEEACRALILLDAPLGRVRTALSRASDGLLQRLHAGENHPSSRSGMYCCGICSVSLWRHLAAGGLHGSQWRLEAGLKTLKAHRLGDGRWRRFPYWYTLLVLNEIDLPPARGELRYAAPVCERFLKRPNQSSTYAVRHRVLAERTLEKC
jgi:hypothetical protein